MKRIILSLSWCLFAMMAVAQVKGEHEYVLLQHVNHALIYIVSPDEVTQKIELTSTELKQDSHLAYRKVMQLVQQHEREGWELVMVNHVPGSFLMRRPKR
ncbi:MAG: hypothetical protein KF905_13445 [Flavobacteriales bacterium]|nr:hypothetical protein [Flavobacteriales bacterium]